MYQSAIPRTGEKSWDSGPSCSNPLSKGALEEMKLVTDRYWLTERKTPISHNTKLLHLFFFDLCACLSLNTGYICLVHLWIAMGRTDPVTLTVLPSLHLGLPGRAASPARHPCTAESGAVPACLAETSNETLILS